MFFASEQRIFFSIELWKLLNVSDAKQLCSTATTLILDCCLEKQNLKLQSYVNNQ